MRGVGDAGTLLAGNQGSARGVLELEDAALRADGSAPHTPGVAVGPLVFKLTHIS